MRTVVFTVLCVLCIPFFLLGLFAFMLPLMFSRGVVSGTTYEPFNSRYQYELLGLRADPAARLLARSLPATNLIVRVCVFHLLTLLCRITGLIPPALSYPPSDLGDLKSMVAMRTHFIDKKLQAFSAENGQILILGAGWDTRGYGNTFRKGMPVYEVDTPATQTVKKRAVNSSGLEQDAVTFVPCDFETEQWLEKLIAAGFEPDRPTFVIWEGVTMYLSERTIHDTLQQISQFATGSQIVFDFLPEGWWRDEKAGRAATSSIRITYGEKFNFFLRLGADAEATLTELLSSHDLNLISSCIQRLPNNQAKPFYGIVLAENQA
ncbi:MAG: SAM-dependent methyltransferase [Pseudomonadales bacterium]|nr:SAM-dependent methyltransferase [Pseudomonadales bacterium]